MGDSKIKEERMAQEAPEQEGLELTQREVAIAQGQDPDEITEEVTEEVTEDAGEPEPGTPEAEAGQDADPGDGAGGGTEAPTGPPEWVTDDVRAQASSYGLDDDLLSTFSSLDEFRRAGAIFDRQVAKKESKEPESAKEPGSPQETEPAKPGRVDRAKFEELGYGEEVLAIVDALNARADEAEALRRDSESVRSMVSEFTRQKYLESFHDTVDAMDEGRYGRSVRDGRRTALDQKVDDNRRKLFETAGELEAGIIARARASGVEPNLPPMPVLLQRAEQLVFGEEIRKAEREAQAKRIADQARKRRPSPSRPAARKAPAEETDADPIKEVVNAPAVVALWNRFQEENGAK